MLVFVMYNFYVIVLQSMWRITKKGSKEAKNIFNIKKGMDLGFTENNVEKKEMGFEYFEDSIEIEVSKIESDSDIKSNENVILTRNLKAEKIEGKE